MRTFMIAGVSAAALLALSACNSEQPADTTMTGETTAEQPATPAADGTVVEVAQGNPEFSTLVEAVTAADLAGTLNGAGPFTVFAPTNAAFDKIPEPDLQALLQPAAARSPARRPDLSRGAGPSDGRRHRQPRRSQQRLG